MHTVHWLHITSHKQVPTCPPAHSCAHTVQCARVYVCSGVCIDIHMRGAGPHCATMAGCIRRSVWGGMAGTTLCYAMLMLCYAMLCYAMLCYAIILKKLAHDPVTEAGLCMLTPREVDKWSGANLHVHSWYHCIACDKLINTSWAFMHICWHNVDTM